MKRHPLKKLRLLRLNVESDNITNAKAIKYVIIKGIAWLWVKSSSIRFVGIRTFWALKCRQEKLIKLINIF